jgi:hypothetical protein
MCADAGPERSDPIPIATIIQTPRAPRAANQTGIVLVDSSFIGVSDSRHEGPAAQGMET